MMEMASVSCNRMRMDYYARKGKRYALRFQYLTRVPSRLFGTVLLGANIALQIGSEGSRECYRAVGLNPDWAPLSQILIVVLFAELIPLIAARHYAEHVVRLGTPLLYFLFCLFRPLIWLLGGITHIIHLCLGKKRESSSFFLSRDALQKVIESHETEDPFTPIVANLFSLRDKTAEQVMTPISEVEMVRASITVAELHHHISESPQSFFPLYHKHTSQIVAIGIARDLVRVPANRRVRDYARPPWFIMASTPLMAILHQFRSNGETVGVVLNTEGRAVGILTLDALLEEIFSDPSLDRDPTISLPTEKTPS